MSDISEGLDLDNADEELMELDEEMHTEIVDTELDAQEIEIESDLATDPEALLSYTAISTTPIPPLRPLTIAPKPAKGTFNYKSAAGGQVFVLQGAPGAQTLKLVTSVAQGLTLNNIQSGKPVTIRTVPKTVPINTLSVLQPKQLITKKIIQPTKTTAPNESKTILLKASSGKTNSVSQNNIIVSSEAKTITLAQAQQLGIFPANKIMGAKETIVIPKSTAQQIKLLTQSKQPPKILPAPERIMLKPTNSSSSNLVTSGQLIQVPSDQQFIAGQLHQINLPGKGIQYVKIVSSSAPTTGTSTTVSTNTLNTKKFILAPSTDSKLPLLTPVSNVGTKLNNLVLTEAPSNTTLKQLKPTSTSLRPTFVPSVGQLLLLPAPKVAIPQLKTVTVAKPVSESAISDVGLDSNGLRPRKPCNCTRSQCLKLYCDCFANGEFCYMCNCTNCANNLENEELRQRAIKNCLDRNPNAFRPKIGKAKDTGDAAIRKHTKGCNCKRSGCLKNYCECYEAKIACSSNCKCVGCRNVEDGVFEKSLSAIQYMSHRSSPPLSSKVGTLEAAQARHRRLSNKFTFSFITDEVIEATSQCLLTISEKADNVHDEEQLKHDIIEEFGRCLMEIIECSSNRNVSTNN